MILVLEFFAVLHSKVIYHVRPLVSKFNRHRNTDNTSITLVALTQLECNLVNLFIAHPVVTHLIQENLALLGDDVLALPSKGGEYLEVVLLLTNTQFIDDASRQHRLGQSQQIVLVHCNLYQFKVLVVVTQFLYPLNLKLSLLLFCISDSISVDHDQFGILLVGFVVLRQASLEQLDVGFFSYEFPVLLVQNKVLAGPVLQLRIQTVGHDKHTRFLVVIDTVAHINTHKHGVIPFIRRNYEVILRFKFYNPR